LARLIFAILTCSIENDSDLLDPMRRVPSFQKNKLRDNFPKTKMTTFIR
jgi:hypothetical protein